MLLVIGSQWNVTLLGIGIPLKCNITEKPTKGQCYLGEDVTERKIPINLIEEYGFSFCQSNTCVLLHFVCVRWSAIMWLVIIFINKLCLQLYYRWWNKFNINESTMICTFTIVKIALGIGFKYNLYLYDKIIHTIIF